MFEVSSITNQPQPKVAFKAKPNAKKIQQLAKSSDSIGQLNNKLGPIELLKIWFGSKLYTILSHDMFSPKSKESMQKTYRRSRDIVDDASKIISNKYGSMNKIS